MPRLRRPADRLAPQRRVSFVPRLEQLDERLAPAVLTVDNLADSGAGSLRQAMLDANSLAGADTIVFSVTGTILLSSGALPGLTGETHLDGRTAPGLGETPRVEVDCNGFGGLRFLSGAANSSMRQLAVIRAGGSGVTLEGRDIALLGNNIGVRMDGATAAGNGGVGVEVRASSTGNQIGGVLLGERNLISANGSSGIALVGAARNRIVNNLIGTDFSGALDLGNGGDGITLTAGAFSNTIGGVAQIVSGVAKPPEGNVISGNGGNGVLIEGASRFNSLSGNFIGTDREGLEDVGNALDGVAIVDGSNDNSLIGTYRNLPPFVFFNVIGGNGGNGLRIRDSNRTLVHANYFGLGSDDETNVGNELDGVLVEGKSSDTEFGGVIPLGNVTACNGQHGVEVKDKAKNFLAFNTFAGLASFKPYTNLGNGGDGFHITSTGSGIVLRTNVISGNGDDGVEVSGAAQGVQIVQNFIGLLTNGKDPLGNGGNGVEIGGTAKDTLVGGPQGTFSIIARNAISANAGAGVAVLGFAKGTRINFSYIGLSVEGAYVVGNGGPGVYLGAATRGTVVGSRDPALLTVISGNGGPGVEIDGSKDNVVQGCLIGTDAIGLTPIPNHGAGVLISGSGNLVGGTKDGAGNVIAFNEGVGVHVDSGSGNSIRRNSIYLNALSGIGLAPDANKNRAAPALTSAVSAPGNVRVAGTVAGKKHTWLTIDIFASFDDDPFAPQGRFYLGTVKVKTDANGSTNFAFRAYSPPPGVQYYTATVTDADGNSSAFSNGIIAVG